MPARPPRFAIAFSLAIAAALPAAEGQTLGAPEARRQVAAAVPPGLHLVSSQGAPHVLLHDLDADGQPEVFALAIQGDPEPGDSVEELSHYGRLFDPEQTDRRFWLLLFSNRSSRLSLARSVDLGTWRVLAAMDLRRISRDQPYPLALSYVFQTLDGAEHVWIVLSRDLRTEPARSQFRETLSSEVSALDVDADGLLDIVTAEHAKEGSGRRETYLTWYRWTGRAFREYASTVIVRNLVQFLARTRAQLLDRDYDDLVRDALEPAAAERLRRAGKSSRQIIEEFFPYSPAIGSIHDVVLPDIRESPFRLPSEAPASVTLEARILDTSGSISFIQIVVAVSRNPFVEPQFFLLPAILPW